MRRVTGLAHAHLLNAHKWYGAVMMLFVTFQGEIGVKDTLVLYS